MSKMIQIRNVPDELHRRAKARAALEGRSLSEYLLGEMRMSLERPTRQEIIERIRKRARAALKPSPANVLRRERSSR